MLWDMHLCVFYVRLSFENRVYEEFKLKFILPTITSQDLHESTRY